MMRSNVWWCVCVCGGVYGVVDRRGGGLCAVVWVLRRKSSLLVVFCFLSSLLATKYQGGMK
jgi:hypothetical protein